VILLCTRERKTPPRIKRRCQPKSKSLGVEVTTTASIMGVPKFNPIRDVLSGAIMAATSVRSAKIAVDVLLRQKKLTHMCSKSYFQVPQLIAYAETVGYAGYRGLATAGPPLFAWGLVTGSPFMNSGVTSITALMAKTDLDGESYVAEYGEEEYVNLVAAYSLYVGLASVLLALVGFGSLAQRVPKTVRSGFKVCHR
jgi:MFS superfamily sulfate permease-like transporter